MSVDIRLDDAFDVDLRLPIDGKCFFLFNSEYLFVETCQRTIPSLKQELQCVNVSGLKLAQTSLRNGVNRFQSSSN
jgi:hypothetical protein